MPVGMVCKPRTVLLSAVALLSGDAAVSKAHTHQNRHRHHAKHGSFLASQPPEDSKPPAPVPSREGETFKTCDSLLMFSNVPGADPFVSVAESMDKCTGFFELTKDEFLENGELEYSYDFFGKSVKLYWDKENIQWVCANTNDGQILMTIPRQEGPQFSTFPPVQMLTSPTFDRAADSAFLDADGDMNATSKTTLNCNDANWKPWSCTAPEAQASKTKCQGEAWPNKQFCEWDKDASTCSQPQCLDGASEWKHCPTGVIGAPPVPGDAPCLGCADIGDRCGLQGQLGTGEEIQVQKMAYEVCPQCGCLAVTCEWQTLDDHGEGSTACSEDRNEWTDHIFGETHKPGSGLKTVDECKTKCRDLGQPYAVWAPSDVEPTCICQAACESPVEKKNRFAFELVCKTPEQWEVENAKAEDDDSEDDDEEEETTTTQKPEPAPVVAVVTIHNLDYNTMAGFPLLHAQVEAVVRDSIASQAGDDIKTDEVSLVSWPGSVRARAVIKPADNVEAITLVAELKKSVRDLNKMISKGVGKVQGIEVAIAKDKQVKTDTDVLVAEKVSSVSRVLSKPKGHDHLEEVYELEKSAAAARLTLGAIAAQEKEIHGRLLAAAENATKQEKLLAKARNSVQEAWYGKKKVKSDAALSRCGFVSFLLVVLVTCLF